MKDSYLSGIELFKRVYGEKIFSYPSFADLLIKFVFILESLSNIGDVSKVDNSYQAEPIVLKTFSEFEEDNRREKSRSRHNLVIAGLTIVIAATALFQALDKSP